MRIPKSALRADGLLLLTAAIWGAAFSAQRSGMQSIGPFGFNAVRFALGALSVLPLLLIVKYRARRNGPSGGPRPRLGLKVAYAAITGAVLFCGTSLQQAGLVTTTAGNAGFITALYVVLVPLVGIAFGKRSGPRIWIGAILALAGLYILSVGSGFKVSRGDLLELAGAFFWTLHILVVGRFGSRMDGLELAVGQYLTCAALSLAGALAFEPQPFAGTMAAAAPILYGGICSTGIAFTLQIFAQKDAHPAHASIILSLESLFAAICGIILLGEPLTARLAIGGALMLAGTIVSQLEPSPPAARPSSSRASSGHSARGIEAKTPQASRKQKR
jgi:drug/metabolite transporter (DMT)-like permease